MKALLAAAIAVTTAFLLNAGNVLNVATYVPHDKVSATMIKGGALISEKGVKVLANRRGAAPPEMHDKTNHVFIIVEGEATLVVGGSLVNPRQPRPGQWSATSIDGGQTYHVTKGDVITIPAKTPHWWKEVANNSIAYYAINIENQEN